MVETNLVRGEHSLSNILILLRSVSRNRGKMHPIAAYYKKVRINLKIHFQLSLTNRSNDEWSGQFGMNLQGAEWERRKRQTVRQCIMYKLVCEIKTPL